MAVGCDTPETVGQKGLPEWIEMSERKIFFSCLGHQVWYCKLKQGVSKWTQQSY